MKPLDPTAPEAPLFDYAVVDSRREERTGYPEAVYCQGKTVDQAEEIILRMRAQGLPVLATRAQEELGARICSRCPGARYDQLSRVLMAGTFCREEERKGLVAVLTAGTSDLPAAREALLSAEFLGSRALMIADVGVAGIHRLFDRLADIRKARVVIAAAGMEGTLPGVVAGLVRAPVIALPTSAGYGASFGGLAALLGMLTSCAPGVSVVNIDNGFGAGYQANLINRLS
jgi:NCAIR mutase (PurE)-related protein